MRAPALFALLLLVAGILLGDSIAVPSLAFLGVSVISTAVALVYALIDRPLLSRAALAAALVTSGAFLTRQQLTDFPNNHISHFTSLGGRTSLIGVVSDEPDIRPDRTYLVVAAESLTYLNRTVAVCGKLRVRVAESTAAFNYKDRVRFSGFVGAPPAARNPGAFDYNAYLAARGIHAVCYLTSDDRLDLLASGASDPFVRSLVVPVRDYIVTVFDRHLSREHSALLRGFLIGDVRFIPPEVHARFKDTGTLHVLAASGSNVGYVLFTIFLVLRPLRLRKPYRYFPAILGVVIFSFLAFNQPSVVRASVMAVVALIGLSLHRDNNWLNSVSIAGLIILAFRPLYLFDLGTQLSFAAAFALILFMPACESWLPQGKSWPMKSLRYLLMLVLGSIVAQLGVIPILLHSFHGVPLVSFLANIVIVPLVGLIATVGILLVFLSPLSWVAPLLGTALSFLMNVFDSALGLFDALPIPPIEIGNPSLIAVLAYYSCLLLIFFVLTRRRFAAIFLWLFVLFVALSFWTTALAGSGRATRVTVLDTFRTPTILIESPGQGTTLINGGGQDRAYDAGESIVLPYLRFRGIHSLERVLLTTAEQQNEASIKSVIDGLSRRTNRMGPSPQWADPNVRLRTDSVAVLLITQPVSVQILNSLEEPINVLGLDWRLLDIPQTSELIDRCRPRTVLILNYFRRYGGLEALSEFRSRHPGVTVYSTRESGALELIIENHRCFVLAESNS